MVALRQIFGPVGAGIATIALISPMALIIQTAFLESSRATHSMATENNLPKIFGTTNKNGAPVLAMVTIAILDIFLIGVKTPSAIVTVSSIGYIFANRITLLAYYKFKSKINNASDEQFHAPRLYRYISGFFRIVNLSIFLCDILYLNSIDLGWKSSITGLAVLGLCISQWTATKRGKALVKTSKKQELV